MSKSVLDGVPVNDAQYKETMARLQGKKLLSVVGHCPDCGAAIYGEQTIQSDATPTVKHSCSCKESKGLAMRTT